MKHTLRSARLIAMGLNCEKEETYKAPCMICETCKQISKGVDLDVLEVDVSALGEEAFSRITESFNHEPARDRYKVLIAENVSQSSFYQKSMISCMYLAPSHVRVIADGVEQETQKPLH